MLSGAARHRGLRRDVIVNPIPKHPAVICTRSSRNRRNVGGSDRFAGD
jgi:hypothetical protein